MGFLFDLLGGFIGGRLVAAWQRRRDRDRELDNCVKGLMRVVEGSQAGLPSATWRVVIASLSERLITADGVALDVSAIDHSRERTPGAKESWFGPTSGMRVLHVKTPTARVEWALPAAQVDWAIGEVLHGD